MNVILGNLIYEIRVFSMYTDLVIIKENVIQGYFNLSIKWTTTYDLSHIYKLKVVYRENVLTIEAVR